MFTVLLLEQYTNLPTPGQQDKFIPFSLDGVEKMLRSREHLGRSVHSEERGYKWSKEYGVNLVYQSGMQSIMSAAGIKQSK